MTHYPSEGDISQGLALIEEADRLTQLRYDLSPILGIGLALTDSTVLTSIVSAQLIVTDWEDGKKARQGAELAGTETTLDGAINDPAADRRLSLSSTIGLAARFFRQGNYGGSAIMTANATAGIWRERRMKINRALALEHKLDPKAIAINKAKFALIMTGNFVLGSPLTKNRTCRRLGFAALSAGTAVGIIGERVFRNRISNAIAAKDNSIAEQCPYTVASPEY